MNYAALLAFAALFSVAIAFALGAFVRRGQGPRVDDAPPAIDFGRSSLESLPRAPSLPPPGHTQLTLEPPPVPARSGK